MLPATLVTLVTFLLDLSNSSPVYNMQPAFITTNIGATNGRNIRNLPCISRKNSELSGVCMFAIDCLKSNGTHLGTCIDRFYFGSCCHIEPIKELENSIETNIILDNREPPQRKHNTTSNIVTSTQTSLSSNDVAPQVINKFSQQNYTVTTSTTENYNSSNKITTSKITNTATPNISSNKITTSKITNTATPSSSSNKITTSKITSTATSSSSSNKITTSKITSTATTPSSISMITSPTRPFGEKIPTESSTISSTSTTEVTTTAQKLQTFQVIDGSLLETTTPKPIKPSTSKHPSVPFKTSTKNPNTTTKPRPAITAPSRPYQRPTRPSSTSSKPSSKPTKPISSNKPTHKPVKISSSTRRPHTTTTTRTTSTRRTATAKPTRRVTKPSATATTIKPASTSQPPVRITTTKTPTTTKPPVVLTKKPAVPTTTSPSTTKAPTTITSARPTEPVSIITSTSQSPITTSSSFIPTSQTPTVSTTAISTEEPVSKKNLTQILESGTINPATNEVIESSGLPTLGNGSTTSTSTAQPLNSTTVAGSIEALATDLTEKTSSFSSTITILTTSPIPLSSESSTSTSSSASSTTSSTPESVGDLITWTHEDTKNNTVAGTSETSVTEDIIEDWVPITTPDGWVLLPSVTPITTYSPHLQDEITTAPTTLTSSSVEPLSTFIPVFTASPESPISSEISLTTDTIESTSNIINTTLSPITSTMLTSVGENITTALPSLTEIPSNVTSTEASPTTDETTGSVTSTEIMGEAKPVNMTDFTDVCGRRMWPEARIVGGEKATFGKWPWQISLRQWRTSTYLHKCGAALLNENWAITAAHCVDNVPPSDLLLRLGEHDLSTEGEPYLHEERRVQIVASHPQFDPRTFEYDLALLRFYEPVQFQPNILPVCVPKSDENFVGRTAHVTGWGRLYEDGPLPSILQEVSVPVINNSVCESMYRSAGYIEHIPNIFICAGWRKGGFDSCEGDSGGPMVIQREDKRFLLAGVISWGIGCAEPNQPGVYTRISEFREWINQILQF